MTTRPEPRMDDARATSTIARRAAETDDVSALVARARGGDRWARGVLYRAHLQHVLRVATFVLGRSADVEDVVQDAFVHAFERLGGLRDDAAFGSWLGRITANLARMRLRRRRFLRFFGMDRGEEDVSFEQLASRDASPEQRTELASLARALRDVSADARTAWVLREVEGWPLGEIAEALGVSLATSKRRIAEAARAVAAWTGDQEGASHAPS